jgi:hypothetical protein
MERLWISGVEAAAFASLVTDGFFLHPDARLVIDGAEIWLSCHREDAARFRCLRYLDLFSN